MPCELRLRHTKDGFVIARNCIKNAVPQFNRQVRCFAASEMAMHAARVSKLAFATNSILVAPA